MSGPPRRGVAGPALRGRRPPPLRYREAGPALRGPRPSPIRSWDAGLALLGDGYLSPSLADIAVPFGSDYQRVWTSLGIVAGWMLLLLGLSYYVRGRIGPARRRRLHRFTALAWVLGVVHGIGEGTDVGSLWFVVTAMAVVVPAAALLGGRLAASRPKPTEAPA